jgi:hypothetical protein
MSTNESTTERDRCRLNNDRFRAFMVEAESGDELAIHSLWIEYQIDFEREGGRYV